MTLDEKEYVDEGLSESIIMAGLVDLVLSYSFNATAVIAIKSITVVASFFS